MGPVGLGVAHLFVGPMYRAFFRDIPETRWLFETFDYSTIAPEMIDRSWVPSYCRIQGFDSPFPMKTGAGARS
jgi:hypothetical protein